MADQILFTEKVKNPKTNEWIPMRRVLGDNNGEVTSIQNLSSDGSLILPAAPVTLVNNSSLSLDYGDNFSVVRTATVDTDKRLNSMTLQTYQLPQEPSPSIVCQETQPTANETVVWVNPVSQYPIKDSDLRYDIYWTVRTSDSSNVPKSLLYTITDQNTSGINRPVSTTLLPSYLGDDLIVNGCFYGTIEGDNYNYIMDRNIEKQLSNYIIWNESAQQYYINIPAEDIKRFHNHSMTGAYSFRTFYSVAIHAYNVVSVPSPSWYDNLSLHHIVAELVCDTDNGTALKYYGLEFEGDYWNCEPGTYGDYYILTTREQRAKFYEDLKWDGINLRTSTLTIGAYWTAY